MMTSNPLAEPPETRINPAMLEQVLVYALKQSQNQLSYLISYTLELSPTEISTRIEALFEQCKRFADQLDQLEQEQIDISNLESRYIEFLMALTEFDGSRCRYVSRSARVS